MCTSRLQGLLCSGTAVPPQQTEGERVSPPFRCSSTLACNQREVDERWQRYFSSIEHGDIIPFRTFVNKAVRAGEHAVQEFSTSEVTIDAGMVPTMRRLRAGYQQLKPGRRTGVDPMPPRLLAVANKSFANIFHSLHFKCVVYASEPLQWRGSLLVNLLKAAAGDAMECSNSRGIALADFQGKVHHRGIRNHLLPTLLDKAMTTQFGGLPGRGTDVATHIIRALIHDAVLNKRCVAVIFADISAAFYSVIRQLVANVGFSDDQLVALRRRLKSPQCSAGP